MRKRTGMGMWDVWSPHYGLTGFVSASRTEAIRKFVDNADLADEVRLSFDAGLTSVEENHWRKWKRRGYIAVHVLVEVCDYRATP